MECEFGDLVENKEGRRGVFLRLIEIWIKENPQRCCILLANSSGDFLTDPWNVDELELIQRGFCNVSLKKIRDKLTGKEGKDES